MPKRLRDYELLRRIATGGMSEVYEARSNLSTDPRERVVIKRLLPMWRGDDAAARYALHNEVDLLQHLKHPNIVQLLSHDLDCEEPFLALQYVDGVSLADLMSVLRATNRTLPSSLALLIVDQLLDALICVHEARTSNGIPLGIVHRDVTPRNVLLGLDGRVLLTDFGIARSAHFAGGSRPGMVKGTVRYFAPEQATGHPMDARSDLYSAGIVLFELLTGTRYLQGRTEAELLTNATRPTARRPSQVADVDPIVDYLTLRALSIRPDDRYPDARTFRAAVSALSTTHLVASPQALATFVEEITLGRRKGSRAQEKSARPRKWPWTLAIAALLVFGLGVGAYMALGSRQPDPPLGELPSVGSEPSR